MILQTAKQTKLIHIFAVSGLITVITGIFVTSQTGLVGLWIFLVLALLEISFSLDNAIINSRILERMSPIWQKLFLTVGIFIAVFVIRFALPILIVMVAAGLGFSDVMSLAFSHPQQYAEALHKASPIINAFGGTFLLLLGINYFFDNKKVIHWLWPIERIMAHIGKVHFVKLLVTSVVALILYLTVDGHIRNAVLLSSVIGTALQFGLSWLSTIFDKKNNSMAGQRIGMAAFALFLYLEVLDASLSFDGVIGAFAITSSILLIITGLGVGAFWVRSLTIYLMRAKTLSHYQYLEHGAHWAILALAVVMLVKLYNIQFADWVTGSLGVVFIGTAVLTSYLEKRADTHRI
jgi:hypothetical protein